VSIGGTSSVIHSVCDYKYLAYDDMAEEGIQLHHHGENSDDDEDNVDDFGMDLDEARAPGRTMVDIQIQLLHNGPQMVTIVDQNESFAPTEYEVDEAVAEAIELNYLITNVALKDIPADLYLSCTWFTPVLTNDATVLTVTTYHISRQEVSDLIREVDAKYIISVVELL